MYILASMSTGYQIYNQHGYYFLTFQVVGWVDIFTREDYRQVLMEAFSYCIHNKGLRVHAYVVMSNHVHCILSASVGNLSDIIRSLKSWSAKALWQRLCTGPESRREWMKAIFSQTATAHQRNSSYQIWTHENHALELTGDAFTRSKLNYLHQNPVRARWVLEAQDWFYSSAAAYYFGEQRGPLTIAFIL